MANVSVPILSLPPVIAIDGSETIAVVQGGTTKSATLDQAIDGTIKENFPGAIEYVMDGGSLSLSVGLKGVLTVPFDCTINYIDLYLIGAAGSVEVDILKCTYDEYDGGSTHPVPADSILDGTYPAIVVDTKARVSYGNQIAISAGDVLGFYVRSANNAFLLTTAIQIARA